MRKYSGSAYSTIQGEFLIASLMHFFTRVKSIYLPMYAPAKTFTEH
jgi:hypothetical protein